MREKQRELRGIGWDVERDRERKRERDRVWGGGKRGWGDMRTQCRDKQLGRTKGERTHHGRIRITKG